VLPATATPTPTIPGATMQANGFTFTFDVAPAKVGTNIVHMYATKPDRKDATIKEWRVTATSAAGPISGPALALSPGHAVGQIDLPAAGVWRFSFTLRVSDTDEEQLYADVRIS
jgi:copper transport protein